MVKGKSVESLRDEFLFHGLDGRRYSVVKELVWVLVACSLFPRLRKDKAGSRKQHKTGEANMGEAPMPR
jgi:hypothetical protein